MRFIEPYKETIRNLNDMVGIRKQLIPAIAINAEYENPPPNPTDEHAKATMKNSVANI